jgi:hypothetical protein
MSQDKQKKARKAFAYLKEHLPEALGQCRDYGSNRLTLYWLVKGLEDLAEDLELAGRPAIAATLRKRMNALLDAGGRMDHAVNHPRPGEVAKSRIALQNHADRLTTYVKKLEVYFGDGKNELSGRRSLSYTETKPMKEWAKIFGKSDTTLHDWFVAGKNVRARKIGGSWAVAVSDLPHEQQKQYLQLPTEKPKKT